MTNRCDFILSYIPEKFLQNWKDPYLSILLQWKDGTTLNGYQLRFIGSENLSSLIQLFRAS